MKRSIGAASALLAVFFVLVPVTFAAEPLVHTGRVVMSTEGDFTLPAGEHADVIIVVNGTATVAGEANTIVAVDGAINLAGGTTESIFAVRSPVELGPNSVVLGDVMQLDSPVHQTGNAELRGQVSDMAAALVGLGAVLAPALLLVWIGFGLATIVSGLLLAGLAARQVRETETAISHEPVMTLATGIVGVFAFPIVAILLMITLVGAPLGVGILLVAWPLVAFVGYLVAGIWIGDWVLRRMAPERAAERPFLAAVVGLLILQAMALVPILGIVSAIASVFGFGAVLLVAARRLRSPHARQPAVPGAMPAPMAG